MGLKIPSKHIDDLDIGDTFIVADSSEERFDTSNTLEGVFMKINSKNDNAVKLNTGELLFITSGMFLYPVKGELII